MRFYFENPYRGKPGHPQSTEIGETLRALFIYRVNGGHSCENYTDWLKDFLNMVVYPRRNVRGFREYIIEIYNSLREWGLVDDETFDWLGDIKRCTEDRWCDDLSYLCGRDMDFPSFESASKHFRRGYNQR